MKSRDDRTHTTRSRFGGAATRSTFVPRKGPDIGLTHRLGQVSMRKLERIYVCRDACLLKA